MTSTSDCRDSPDLLWPHRTRSTGHDPAIPPVAQLRGARQRYGKSTAIALLLGLMKPDAGSAALFGQPPESLAVRRRIGVMLQSAGIPDNAKVAELLHLTRSDYPAPRSVADCAALAGLEGLLDRRYGRLSGGQQRRVQFALAICGNPEVLFLDGPTTGLDIDARQRMWATIRALVAAGTGVLLTTHYLEEAEALAQRVVVLNRGRVAAAGSTHDVRGHEGNPARVEVLTDVAEPVLRRMLAEDAALSDLDIQRAGLADTFLELTRDDAHKEAA
jgi:ABC-2 type transport system ATP-binding protein